MASRYDQWYMATAMYNLAAATYIFTVAIYNLRCQYDILQMPVRKTSLNALVLRQ